MSKWLKDRDLEGIIGSQTVVFTMTFDDTSETIKIPRYLLEKHSYLFQEDFAAHDVADPTRAQHTIPLSLTSWYQRSLPNHVHTEISQLREWNLLRLFCKWMLCGRIVGEPLMHPQDSPWERGCDPLFNADVAFWILEDTAKREAVEQKYPQDRASRHYAS